MSYTKNRFNKYSGVYTCDSCGKKTRETGQGESSARLCAYCFDCASWDNSYLDLVVSYEEYLKGIEAFNKHYKRNDWKPLEK